jgi:hypothetical protein
MNNKLKNLEEKCNFLEKENINIKYSNKYLED